MTVKTLELGGRRWVILPEKYFRRLAARAGELVGPLLPRPDARGQYPAVQYTRAAIARKVVKARRQAGLTQSELARRAGIRPETLNRIEKGRATPDVATIAKIQRALVRASEAEDAQDLAAADAALAEARAKGAVPLSEIKAKYGL